MADATEQTRDRLLRTALSLFTEHGYEGASIGMIASSMGLSKAAVTYHFRTKEDILAAAVEPALADLRAFVERLGTERLDPARRRQAIADYVGLMVKHRAIIAFLFRGRLASASPGTWCRWAETLHEIEDIFGDGDQDPAARLYLRAALGGLGMALTTFPELSDEDLRTYLRTATERMLKWRRQHPERRSSRGGTELPRQ
jgi:AcrR family transcriptional regulator